MGLFSSIGDALGGAIGGIVGGVTGLFGNKQTNSANASINAAQMQLAREQLEYQKELHKNQIRWRVEDAQKAGLHPMAALGLQSSSFSPVSSSFTPMQANDYSWIGDIGQSVGYAAMKAKDKQQQREALMLAKKQSALSLRNMELQNQSLETEIDFQKFRLATAMSGAVGQAFRSAGSASPSGRTAFISGQGDSLTSSGFEEPIKSYSIRLDADGKPTEIIPSDAYKSRVEDTLGVELLPWFKSILLDRGAKDFGLNVGDFYWDSDKKQYVKGDGFWRKTGKVVRKKWKDFKSWLWR